MPGIIAVDLDGDGEMDVELVGLGVLSPNPPREGVRLAS